MIYNKQKLRFVLVTLIYLAIVSCHRDCSESEDIYCTAQELTWISYVGGETLVFRDTSGNTDTIVVTPRNSNIETGQTEVEDPCAPHKYEFVSVILPLQNYGLVLYVQHFGIGTSYSRHYAGISYNTLQFYFDEYTTIQNYQLNGITYQDVYILSNAYSTAGEINKIYYTKSNGIIGYDYLQGQKWVKIN